MTGEEIARLGMKVSASLPLTDDEKEAVERIMAPNSLLQDLPFKPAQNNAATPMLQHSATASGQDDASA